MAPPVFIHFFNWFWGHEWQKGTIVDPFDWSFVGTELEARGTQPFYEKQFAYLEEIGITALAWQYSAVPQPYGVFSYPHPYVIDALNGSRLKMAPFYDYEMSMQAHRKLAPRPELLNKGLLRPDAETIELICEDLSHYYEHVPEHLRAVDANGNGVIFVFGFGFNDDDPDPKQWTWFADELCRRVAVWLGEKFKFYWSSTNTHFQEHLFLHHRDHFTPWHFVVDTPQSQFSHDSVTWNFGFDNLYVKRYHGLKRVVRLDQRYVEEPAWLAYAADPALIFIYGWDEQYESSLLFPTKNWGDTKARLAKHYIQRLHDEKGSRLPRTLLIVDDLDEQWSERTEDWHLTVLREMLLYRFRLFAPQADTIYAAELTPELLEKYAYVIDATSEKTIRLVELIERAWNRLRLLLFDPLAPLRSVSYAHCFFKELAYKAINGEIQIEGTQKHLTVRDDTHVGNVLRGCAVKLWGTYEPAHRVPLIIQNRNATFVNSYANNDDVMAKAFEQFYSRPMGTSIMYGEGFASQRLEQDTDGTTIRNRLLRRSVNLRWPIPSTIDWYKLPPEVEESDFNFVFGLED
ncbi:MAG: hypothetical protein JO193_00125 [Candidatus Eremiobacteraeota bacterium]|nr:hypothetical protein [Candidatus Eremiobacteraeota bacterium]